MIKLRLTNAIDYAVEFQSASEGAFRVQLNKSLSEYNQSGNVWPQLHVWTGTDWLLARYVGKNYPVILNKMVPDCADIWAACEKTYAAGVYVDQFCSGFGEFLEDD